MAENGTLILINVCDAELVREWPYRSHLPFDGKDKKGNNLRYTLLRYLASKKLTKDSVGISKLSTDDIKNIENGQTNYLFNSSSGLASKWREIVWEYENINEKKIHLDIPYPCDWSFGKQPYILLNDIPQLA